MNLKLLEGTFYTSLMKRTARQLRHQESSLFLRSISAILLVKDMKGGS